MLPSTEPRIFLHRGRSGVPWLLWAVSLSAVVGWPGLMVCALAGVACRWWVDDRWGAKFDAASGALRLLRRRGAGPWRVEALLDARGRGGLSLQVRGEALWVRDGVRRVALRFASEREARGAERVLSGLIEGAGVMRGAGNDGAGSRELDTRAPIAEWAWLLGACAATAVLAAVRGMPAGLVVLVPVWIVVAKLVAAVRGGGRRERRALRAAP